MEINIEKAKETFMKYVNNYDIKNNDIERKIYHSLRVMDISKKIAKNLKLDEEKINLATLIGLLHDIARFEQNKKFHTYNDLKSFDHGDYGVKILETEIRNYIETDKYDEIIKKAIKNHNKYEIEDNLSEEEKLFAKIIRDADKIDIIYEAKEIFWKGMENQISNTTISKQILEQFYNKKLIKRKKENRTYISLDEVLSVIAFIFDINFKVSFEIIENENYINEIINRFDFKDIKTSETIRKIKKEANDYIRKIVKESEK